MCGLIPDVARLPTPTGGPVVFFLGLGFVLLPLAGVDLGFVLLPLAGVGLGFVLLPLAGVGLAAEAVDAVAPSPPAARALVPRLSFVISIPVLSAISFTNFSARDGSLAYNSSAFAIMALSSPIEAPFPIANDWGLLYFCFCFL